MNAIDGEDDVASELEDSILGKEGALRSFLLEDTFTKLVSFVGKSFENRSVGRWESKSLALAASSSLPAASRIVGFLVDSLHASLQKDSQGRTPRFCRDFIIYSSPWWKPSFKSLLRAFCAFCDADRRS
jgi:hypothetical protein